MAVVTLSVVVVVVMVERVMVEKVMAAAVVMLVVTRGTPPRPGRHSTADLQSSPLGSLETKKC